MDIETEKLNFGKTYTADEFEELDPVASPISIPRIREPRDMIYSGSFNGQPEGDNPAEERIFVAGKKHQKRKISPFTVVTILFCVAVVSVFYIGNILVVGRLMNQNNQLQIRHRQLLNQQELLKARIIRLSSLERIEQLAHDQLDIRYTKQLPVWIEIDQDQVDKAEEVKNQLLENK